MRWRALLVSIFGVAYVAEVAHLAEQGDWVGRVKRQIDAWNVEVIVAGAPPSRLASGKRLHWPARPITISLDGSLDRLAPDARDAVMDAAGAWLGSGALPDVTFASVTHGAPPAAADGVNAVYAAPITLTGHENDPAITIARVNVATGEILEADIILNQALRWARIAVPGKAPARAEHRAVRGCAGVRDIQSVAAHEFGHFFGLADSTRDGEYATMYQDTPVCTIYKRELGSDDQTAMSSVYPPSR